MVRYEATKYCLLQKFKGLFYLMSLARLNFWVDLILFTSEVWVSFTLLWNLWMNAIKGATTYSNILMILQKIKQLKTVFCNAWVMCFIIIIIIIIIILSWNYIVFCIKRALGVEKKKNYYMKLSALETAQSSEINKKPQCIATNDTTQ